MAPYVSDVGAGYCVPLVKAAQALVGRVVCIFMRLSSIDRRHPRQLCEASKSRHRIDIITLASRHQAVCV
jgi:hypothetical protein